MRKNSQSEIIKQLTDKQLLLNLYFTQLVILLIAFILGMFLFDNFIMFWELLEWRDQRILSVGGLTGLAVVLIDVILMSLLPKRFYDDGGINERIFQNRSVVHIFFLTVVIAISEEVLFRGVIQTHAGLIVASLVFAVIHIRYLSNLFLFCNVLILSFIIGIIYEVTGNLIVTIFMHFTIDFLLGLFIKYKADKKKNLVT